MEQLVARWQNLPVAHKFFVAILPLAFISLFLPWFGDQNQFTAGTVELGISGPTSFVGINAAVFTLFVLIHEAFLLFRNKLIIGDAAALKLYRLIAPLNIYLAVIAASVYLHPEVGANLLAKQLYWGFYCFVASNIALACGFAIGAVEEAKKLRKSLPTRRARAEEEDTHHYDDGDLELEPIDPETMKELGMDEPRLPRELTPDRPSLTIADVVSDSVPVNKQFRDQWKKQKSLEKKTSGQDDDPSIF